MLQRKFRVHRANIAEDSKTEITNLHIVISDSWASRGIVSPQTSANWVSVLRATCFGFRVKRGVRSLFRCANCAAIGQASCPRRRTTHRQSGDDIAGIGLSLLSFLRASPAMPRPRSGRMAGSGAADEFSVDPFTRTCGQAMLCRSACTIEHHDGSEPSSATSAGHLSARSVGHDMAHEIADIALHVVQEVVK